MPATWASQVQTLGQKDPLEKGTDTHFSTLGWGTPWTEEPSRLVHGVAESNMTVRLTQTPEEYHE